MYRHILPYLIVFGLLIIPASLFSQTGTISGKATDKLSSEQLMGIGIRIDSTKFSALTDLQGDFKFENVPVGTYTLTVIASMSYLEQKIANIKVDSGKVTIVTVKLEEPNIKSLTQVEILDVKITNTENAVKNEIKKSDNVVVGMGSNQISKSKDNDAADVIKRLPGVTVIENRFIMVRGLNDRYNSVWLNDAGAPSSETDKKAFSFDIIPSGLIDRILIFKTPSPELPGDFAGGMVKIYTKSFPQTPEFVVNFQSSFRSGTTFKDISSTPGSKSDIFGYDNGYRDLPGMLEPYVSKNDVNNSEETRGFKNTWGLTSHKTDPDQRFSIYYVYPFKFKTFRIGNVTGITYSNVNTVFNIHRQDWDSLAQVYDYTDKQSTNLVRDAFLENISFVSTHHRIDLRTLLNQSGRSVVTERSSNFMTGPNERSYVESYEDKFNFSTQLSGKHTSKKEITEYTWTIGYGVTDKNMPDLKRIKYSKQRDQADTMYSAGIANVVDPVNGGGRFFSSLHEKVYSFDHNFKHKFLVRNYSFEFNFGNYFEFKDRLFTARSLGYVISPSFQAFNLKRLPIDQIFGDTCVGVPGGFRIDEITSLSDKYSAQNKMEAGYFSLNFAVTPKVRILGGVRYEYNVQSLQSHVNTDSISPSITTKFFLPSINASYHFKKDTSLLRLAYGKTLNRPEFREWSPFYFYDFDFAAGTYGSLFPTVLSPEGAVLKVAQIDNFDIRYEYYPNAGDLLQVGAFYKSFKDPIQQVILNSGGSDSRAFTFTNALSAYSRGIELDARKNLSFFDEVLRSKCFSSFNLIANLSLIQSQVTYAKVVNQAAVSPLQGQSPYVVNAGLYYQNDSTGTQVTLLYNVFGPRIYLIGTLDYANIGEMPRSTLDISVSQKISKHFSLSFAVQDILNQPVLLVQDTNKNNKFERDGSDKEILRYKRGPYFSIGLKFKI